MVLNYPEELDFNKGDIITINFYFYYTEKHEEIKNIKLNPEAEENLECENGINVIKCNVPKSHFERKPSGYYHFHYLNHFSNSSTFYESTINIKLPVENEFIIKINHEDNTNIRDVGKKGTISFITSYNDNKYNIFDISDIEENTKFEGVLTDQLNNNFAASCRLWEPLNDKIRIFCNLKDDLNEKTEYININKVTFEYKEYNITIISEEANLPIRQINGVVPFLYSDKQEINVEEEILELTGGEYNEIIFDNCSTHEKELTCSITKEKIEEILGNDGEEFILFFINDNLGYYKFDSVFSIKINYKNIQKENIYVEITNLKENIIDINHFITYETNITTSMNKVISGSFDLEFNNKEKKVSCYFKKSEFNDLLLLCLALEAGKYSLKETTSEIPIDNVNIKYTFIIKPIKYTKEAQVFSGQGSYFFYNYPEVLDFTKQDSFEIILITQYIDYIEKLKLNPDGDDLECNLAHGVMKCTIPMSHFDFEESGYYNIYYKNSVNQLSTHYEATPLKVILPKRNQLKLLIKEEDNRETINIGQKGTLYFITNYNDNDTNIFDPTDIEENTKFTSTITDENKNNYNVNCRLWEPTNEKIVVICGLNANLNNKNNEILLTGVKFDYKDDYKIYLKPETSIKINQFDYEIPFIYSDKQTINIPEDKEFYEVQFKYDSYHNDLLYLYDNQLQYYVALDDCEGNNKKLSCKIPKKQLENYLLFESDYFRVGTINDNIGTLLFGLVDNIYINYKTIEKQDIKVEITKLLQTASEIETSFAYETNIDDIPELTTRLFPMKFNNEFEINCYFKKSNANITLLLLCKPQDEKEYYLGKIDNEITLNNIHYFYNFIIQPCENNEKINIKEIGTSIEMVYPESLNLTAEDDLIVRYIMKDPSKAKNLRLNPEGSILNCDDLIGMKKCIVPDDHFTEINPGYYYTHHSNYLGDSSIYYEANPIYVAFPSDFTKIEIGVEDEDNQDIIKLGKNGFLYLVTNYNDNVKLFEKQIKFTLVFSDSNETEYQGDCEFWKPKDENVRIFCQMKNDFNLGEQIINFKTISIIQRIYNISIYCNATNIRVKQLDSSVSFLYNDKQEIDLNKDSPTPYIKLQKKFYDKHSLYLYQNNLRYIKLNCNENTNEITCDIPKDKLLNILSFDQEKYGISEKINTDGMYKIPSVLDITVKYESTKENINLKIEKLLTPNLAKNEFITYKTNIKKNFPFVFTNTFILETNKNEKMNCLFKNSTKDNLLLLCEAKNEGKSSLGKISQTTINNVNIFYNFIIEGTENNEEYEISGEGAIITSVDPKEMDFTKANWYIITYETIHPENLDSIWLNKDSSSKLVCTDHIWYKECNVTKEHFGKLETNYYYTYHSNKGNKKIISYEVDPIYVILEKQNPPSEDDDDDESNAGAIAGGIIGGVILLALIILLIWYFYKRKSKLENGGLSGTTEVPLVSNMSDIAKNSGDNDNEV